MAKQIEVQKPDFANLEEGDLYYEPDFRMLFVKKAHGLEPYMYDCDEVPTIDGYDYAGTQIPMDRNNIYYLFARYVRRCSDRFDKYSGQRLPGFLETWQSFTTFKILGGCMRLKSENFLIAIARQGGKSFSARLVMVFLSVFAPMATYIKESRYYLAWVSPTLTLGKDHISKMEPFLTAAIELFNEIFPETPLISKEEDRDMQDNKLGYTLDRLTPTGQIPHSQLLLLSADSRSKVPGYTIHVIYADEAQLIGSDYFNINIAPMTNRTGGSIIVQGTSLPNADQLLYATYRKRSIKPENKIMLNILEVYKSVALRSKEEADQLWQKYENEAMDNGVYSDYIQSQYFVSFDIKGDRWLKLDTLESAGIFSKIQTLGIDKYVAQHISNYNQQDPRYYRVASFDSARKHDLAAFCAGILEVTKDTDGGNLYHTNITDFHTINEKEKATGKVINPDVLVDRVCALCIRLGIEYIIYDTSGQQVDRAYYLAKQLRKKNAKTIVIPMDYGGKNKQKMFGVAETIFETGKTSLPSLDLQSHSPSYKELIEEIKVFKKSVEGNTIRYAAPQATNIHDDFVCSVVQLIYLPHHIDHCISHRKKAELDSLEYNYPIRWEKSFNKSSGRKVSYYK